MQFILGILVIVLGVYMILKTEDVLRNFGSSSFFERHLGTEGGSRLGYKLLGLLLIFLGLVIMLGISDDFLRFLLSPLIRVSQ
ncbi:hypothetical protein K9M50_01130 [Patescibacteria group bacterium]|nr:hypothetical protein [Patescibacteria group bacterium]